MGLDDVPRCLRALAEAALAAGPADDIGGVVAAAGGGNAAGFKFACVNAVLAILAPEKELSGMDGRRRITELCRGRVLNYTKKRWPLSMVALMAGVQATTVVHMVARAFRDSPPSAANARRFLGEVGLLADAMSGS